MSNTKFFSLLLLGGFMVLGFQNCGDGFTALDSSSLGSRGGGGIIDDNEELGTEIVPTRFTQSQVETCISSVGAASLVACLDTNDANPLELTQAIVDTCRTNVGSDEPRAIAICLANNSFAPAGYRDPGQIDINRCNDVAGEERLAVCLYNNGVLPDTIAKEQIDGCVANAGVGNVEACLRANAAIDDNFFLYQSDVNDCSAFHGDENIAECLSGNQLIPATIGQVDIDMCIAAGGGTSGAVARCLRVNEKLPVVLQQPMINRCAAAVGNNAIETCLQAQGLLLQGLTQAAINTCIGNGGGVVTGVARCLRANNVIPNRPFQKNFDLCNRIVGSANVAPCLDASGLLLVGLEPANIAGCLENNAADDVTGLENCLKLRGHLASWDQLVGAGGVVNASCMGCHNAVTTSGGFNWLVYANARARVVPGNLAGSLVNQRMTAAANPMPPNGQLPALQIQMVQKWIQQGAVETYE